MSETESTAPEQQMEPTTASCNDNSSNDRWDCPVCFDTFERQNPDFIPFQRCSHGMCQQCLNIHLQTSNRCPVCRVSIRDEIELLTTTLNNLKEALTPILEHLTTLKSINSRSLITQNQENESSRQPQLSSDNLQLLHRVRDDIKKLENLLKETGLTLPNQSIPAVLRHFEMGLSAPWEYQGTSSSSYPPVPQDTLNLFNRMMNEEIFPNPFPTPFQTSSSPIMPPPTAYNRQTPDDGSPFLNNLMTFVQSLGRNQM